MKKTTIKIRAKMRSLYEAGMSIKKIAEETGFSRPTVTNIVSPDPDRVERQRAASRKYQKKVYSTEKRQKRYKEKNN